MTQLRPNRLRRSAKCTTASPPRCPAARSVQATRRLREGSTTSRNTAAFQGRCRGTAGYPWCGLGGRARGQAGRAVPAARVHPPAHKPGGPSPRFAADLAARYGTEVTTRYDDARDRWELTWAPNAHGQSDRRLCGPRSPVTVTWHPTHAASPSIHFRQTPRSPDAGCPDLQPGMDAGPR